MNSPFGNVQQIPGLGFVEVPSSNGRGSLHGEADVMMISGLGQEGAVSVRSDTGQVVGSSGTFSVSTLLGAKVKVFGIEIPAWALLLIAVGALGAGWVFFKKMNR